MAISANQKPTIYRNLYENTGPESVVCRRQILSTKVDPRTERVNAAIKKQKNANTALKKQC